jgi:hypothetical protein
MEQPEYAAEAVQSWSRAVVLVPILVILAMVGALFPPLSWAATIYVVLVGGALIGLGVSGWVPRRSAPTTLSTAAGWWLLPIGFFAVVEVADIYLGSTHAHPTLSVLLDPPLDRYPIRVAGYAVWLSGFWTLVRR